MSDLTITPSEIEMIAWNAGYRIGKQENEAEIQTLKNEIDAMRKFAIEVAALHDPDIQAEMALHVEIAELRAEVHKYKDAAEAWTVMVDEQAEHIGGLDRAATNYKKQIKGLYDAIDEARDEHARLSDKVLEATAGKFGVNLKFDAARVAMEQFADDLESTKYTYLIGQELRNRWKTAMNSELATNP